MLGRVLTVAALLVLGIAAASGPAAATQGEGCVKDVTPADCTEEDALVCVGYPIGCNLVYVKDPR